MKHLTIIVPEGQNNLSSIIGSYKIISRANEYWKQKGRNEVFNVQLAGISKNVEYYDGLFSVKPHTNISDIQNTHFIIIPSLNHNYIKAVAANQPIIRWIEEQYKNGAEIASMCTGAFILASTGLLDGRSCSTHWIVAESFRKMFPKVNLQMDKIITDEKGIYTNGGAFSFLNLLLYLIEKYYDRETAIYCSKVFEIDLDRNNQSQFFIFSGQKNHEDEDIKKAQAFIESSVETKINIEELSSRLFIDRRNFDRRFKKATGNTPVEYMQRVKVEAAKKSFETSRKSISEVMYDVGYSDAKAFREVFKKITYMSPIEYRNKYYKDAIV